MKTTKSNVMLSLLLTCLVFLVGCTMDTGRLFLFWDQTVAIGFGSDEPEGPPVRDGNLKFKSDLLEDFARSKFEAKTVDDENPDNAENTVAANDGN